MTIVEALKALYEALGGDPTDLDGLNTKAAVLAQIAELAETIDGGGSGADGASAYEIAVANGFSGTEAEWLASLKGEDGQDGADAEPFVVTLTTQDGTSFTGNKTYGEIVEAKLDGSRVVFSIDFTGYQYSIDVITVIVTPAKSGIYFTNGDGISKVEFTPAEANDTFEWEL